MKYIYIIILIVFVSFASFVVSIDAQVRNTDIVLTINPLYPEPNQSTEATISSYAVDLTKSYVSWWVNGDELSRGVGKTSFTFNSGSLGSTTNIVANIETVDGQSLKKEYTVLTSNTDMLWQATDSYVPPFYKGKALGVREGNFKVVAIPNVVLRGQKMSPNNFSYTWEKDQNGQTNSSGWGKSYLMFKNSFLDETNEVEVKVSDVYGAVVGKGTISIPTFKPKIVFGTKDASTGVYNKQPVSKTLKTNTTGITLSAVPYFFTTRVPNFDDLQIRWYADGNEVSTTYPKNEILVKSAEGKNGSGQVRVTINNNEALFQEAERSVVVNF